MTKQEIIDKAMADLASFGWGMENSLIVDIDTVYTMREALDSEAGRTAIFLSFNYGVFISDEDDYLSVIPGNTKQFLVARVGMPIPSDVVNRRAFRRGQWSHPRVYRLLNIISWATNEIDGL